jgi:hypothetical protein
MQMSHGAVLTDNDLVLELLTNPPEEIVIFLLLDYN